MARALRSCLVSRALSALARGRHMRHGRAEASTHEIQYKTRARMGLLCVRRRAGFYIIVHQVRQESIDVRDECTMSIAVCILLVFRSFLDSAVSFVRGEVLSLRRARERAANEGARQREGARQKSVRAGAGGLGDNVIRSRPYTRCSQRLDDPCQRSVSVSGFTQYVQRHCLYAIWPRQGEVE